MWYFYTKLYSGWSDVWTILEYSIKLSSRFTNKNKKMKHLPSCDIYKKERENISFVIGESVY